MRNERDSELTFTWFSARKGRQYEGTTKQVFLRICLYASMQHTFTQLSIWHLICCYTEFCVTMYKEKGLN